MKERPRKWFHETTELALSLTSYIAPDDADIKDRRVFLRLVAERILDDLGKTIQIEH
jgi:hypothetical protein